jgi:hypothetical protein
MPGTRGTHFHAGSTFLRKKARLVSRAFFTRFLKSFIGSKLAQPVLEWPQALSCQGWLVAEALA